MLSDFNQNSTEDNFIKLLKKGDKQSFAILFDRYAPIFHNIILKFVEDHHTAEEVLQSSFVTIYAKINEFDCAKTNLFIWMYKIVKDISLKTLDQRKEKINKVFSENKGSVLDLVYFYGYNTKEITQILNIPEDKVKKMIHKELKQFIINNKPNG